LQASQGEFIAIVGTVLAEMTAGDSGIGYLMRTAGSQQRMPLAFAGLVVIGVMAMAMYELFSWVEMRTTGWAHRSTQGDG
jgi:NitT/TauT family transport system permease protein